MTPNYAALPDDQAESAIFDCMQAWDEAFSLNRTVIGMMCRDVRDREIFRHRIDPATDQPIGSFSRWMSCAAPRGRSTAFQYMREVTELADVPDTHLAAVLPENVSTLCKLSTGVRNDPAILEAAKTQDARTFVRTVQETHPDQHLESEADMRFKQPQSAADFIDKVLDEAMNRGAANRSEALEMTARTAWETWEFEAQVEDSYRSGVADGD